MSETTHDSTAFAFRIGRALAATEALIHAAQGVNARYIGGSPLRGERFSDAIEALATAEVEARVALRELLAATPSSGGTP